MCPQPLPIQRSQELHAPGLSDSPAAAAIIEHQGIPIILRAARHRLVAEALGVFVNITSGIHGWATSTQYCNAIVEAGTTTLCFITIQESANAGAVCTSDQLVFNLAGQLSFNDNEEVLANILNALRRFSDQPKLCADCCSTLFSLTQQDFYRTKIRELGGLQVVMEAMRGWALDPRVQSQGIGALCHALYCKQNAVLIQQTGGIQLVEDAMETFAMVLTVQINGCNFFCSMAKLNKTDANKSTTAVKQNATKKKSGCEGLHNGART